MLILKKELQKLMSYSNGDDLQSIVKTFIKKAKKYQIFFPQKQLINNVPIPSHNDFIQNHNILSLPCSLSYNLCSEQRSEVDRECSNILNNIIDNIELSLKYESNNDFFVQYYHQASSI